MGDIDKLITFITIGIFIVLKFGFIALRFTPEWRKWEEHEIEEYKEFLSKKFNIPKYKINVIMNAGGEIKWDYN